MKTESNYTSELVKILRQRLPSGVVLKHCDMFTMGVPDLTVTFHRVTTWFEAKRIDEEKVSHGALSEGSRAVVTVNPRSDVPAVQWETLRRLGRGYLIVYTTQGHAVTHVSGFRESVDTMRLRLGDLRDLARQVISISKSEEEE